MSPSGGESRSAPKRRIDEQEEHDEQSAPVSRRRFLGGIGAAAVATSAAASFTARPGQADFQQRFVIREDRFGRMFPELPPFFRENSKRLRDALQDIGKLGGILDARDQLPATARRGGGGVNLIVDPALSANNPNNPAMTAGTTFIGQFIDHDLTFDLTSGSRW